jgi:hypothetical protein
MAAGATWANSSETAVAHNEPSANQLKLLVRAYWPLPHGVSNRGPL